MAQNWHVQITTKAGDITYAPSGIMRRITGTGYLVCTGFEPVLTGTYQVQTGTGNE